MSKLINLVFVILLLLKVVGLVTFSWWWFIGYALFTIIIAFTVVVTLKAAEVDYDNFIKSLKK